MNSTFPSKVYSALRNKRHKPNFPYKMPQGARAWYKVSFYHALALLARKKRQSGLSNEVLNKGFWSNLLSKLKVHFCKVNGEKSKRFKFYSLQLQKPLWYKIMQYLIWKPWLMAVWSQKCKGVVALLPCATPLHLVAFRMENRVCAFCFFKHCTVVLGGQLTFHFR